MTQQETGMILTVIQSTYPKYYSGMSESEKRMLLKTWTALLKDYSYEAVGAALQAYLLSDRDGFPPSPGQLIGQMVSRQKSTDMTAMEAWGLVRKAIANSSYSAKEEFDKLPEACRRAVGSPDNLREMAAMDAKTVDSVEQSHFIRDYNATIARQQEERFIPAKVLEALHNATLQLDGSGRSKELPGKEGNDAERGRQEVS